MCIRDRYEISTSNQTNDTVEPSYHHPTLQVKFLYFYSQLIKAHFYREIRIKDSFIYKTPLFSRELRIKETKEINKISKEFLFKNVF